MPDLQHIALQHAGPSQTSIQYILCRFKPESGTRVVEASCLAPPRQRLIFHLRGLTRVQVSMQGGAGLNLAHYNNPNLRGMPGMAQWRGPSSQEWAFRMPGQQGSLPLSQQLGSLPQMSQQQLGSLPQMGQQMSLPSMAMQQQMAQQMQVHSPACSNPQLKPPCNQAKDKDKIDYDLCPSWIVSCPRDA